MKIPVYVAVLLAFSVHAVFAAGADSAASKATATRPPNILVILTDDLGYSDLGCYGSEIATPNLDQLAKNGLRFSSFYNTARCWPTRAALLTGYYAQQVQRDALPGMKRANRPEWARLVPAMLKTAGYRSYHSGKWHLDGMPLTTGFDRSYYLKDQGRFFSPEVHFEDDKKLPEIKRGTGFYGTTEIANHAVKCLQEHAVDHADRPFFHYLAFTAPHFPLHALPEDIAKYEGRYDAGWEKVRDARFQRIKQMGLVTSPLSAVELDVGPPYAFPDAMKQLGAGEVNRPQPWDSLTNQQKKFQATKMTLHAAMIDRIDVEVGRVLKQLRSMKQFDNTLILFLSDNGASAEIMVRNDGHDPLAQPGSAASYLCLGPGWSTVCNTPFRRHKTWVHEGGTSTPLIAHWPNGISGKGEVRHSPGHVTDIVPTILELAMATQVATPPATVVPGPPGKSLIPLFASDDAAGRSEIWWCHEENKAIRQGDWKLVAAKGDPWELYDLSVDRTEQHNVAEQHPHRVQQMSERWKQQTDQFIELARKNPTKPFRNGAPVKRKPNAKTNSKP
ncbi:UNVERIFIED_CONTAM: hypothetical protein GTU68_006464 [Idotea baltica]|nr:hypothetical protein [Idotea baltica]